MTAMKVALRVVAHLAAEVPLLVIAALQIAHGWVPTSDDAVIALRTWSVFTGPAPLTGQFTQITVAGGHTAFDLGPLQYYLLAIPERIDPVHGLLWGAAVLAAGLAALTIEAVWSSCGPAAGAATGLALAVTAATLVQSSVNLAWNPSTGVYALFATMAASIAVACGRWWWLPVGVAAASLAAQCHTSFVVPVATAVGVGIGLGALKSRRVGLVPLAAAAVAGLACWIAPLIQQLTGHPGNWTVVARSVTRHGPAVGFGVGLRGLAAATHLLPSWWVHDPGLGSIPGFGLFMKNLYDGSEWWGATALVLCLGIAVGALANHRPRLAAVAALAGTTGLAAAWTLGSVPVSQAPYLDYYLYFVLWPVGMLVVAVFVTGTGAALVELRRRVAWLERAGGDMTGDKRAGSGDIGQQGPSERAARLRLAGAGALTGALALAGAGLLALDIPLGSSPLFLMGWHPVDETRTAVAEALPLLRQHEPAGHQRPFDVATSPHFGYYQSNVAEAVAYLLTTKGYPARLSGAADLPLGAPYRVGPHSPTLYVDMGLGGIIKVRWEVAGGGRHA
jgi:hypothetical protein